MEIIKFKVMKLLNKLTILACLFIGALASCESPDLAEGRTDQVNGLLNVTIKIRVILQNIRLQRKVLMRKMKKSQ